MFGERKMVSYYLEDDDPDFYRVRWTDGAHSKDFYNLEWVKEHCYRIALKQLSDEEELKMQETLSPSPVGAFK